MTFRKKICYETISPSWKLIALFVLAITGCEQPGDIHSEIDSVFSHLNENTPGCACSVSREGELIFEKGYGMANFEYDVPIQPTSIFHVASVSKHFTAMAIELLVNEGRVSWDDDIRDYVPEVPDFGKTITLRHLVHHVSGIRDQWNLLYQAGWRWEADVVTQKDVLDITSRQKALNFDPGERYLYSNTGFTLLAVVVERITGQTFREFCGERIFQPLGMNDTHFHDDHEMIVPNRAYAYEEDENGYMGYKISIPDFDVVGATSLFTTVRDMAKWDKNFYTNEVGGEEAFDRFYQRYILNNGDTISYMHGLGTGTYKGLKRISHGGADAGYRSYFVRFPDHGLTVTVLCNFPDSGPMGLANQVAEAFLEDHMETDPAEQETTGVEGPSDLEYLAGYYHHPISNRAYQLIHKEGALWFRFNRDYRLIYVGPERFIFEEFGDEVIIAPNGDDAGLSFPPEKDVFYRKDLWEPDKEHLTSFAGTYHSPELDTKYIFSVENGVLRFHHRKMASEDLKPQFENAFNLDGSTVVFSPEKDQFTLSDGRVWNVRFYRTDQTE